MAACPMHFAPSLSEAARSHRRCLPQSWHRVLPGMLLTRVKPGTISRRSSCVLPKDACVWPTSVYYATRSVESVTDEVEVFLSEKE